MEDKLVRKKKLLVIEDDEDDLLLLTGLLSHERYSVEAAGTIAEAKKYLQNNTADIVIADLTLPDSNGIKTLGVLDSLSHHFPIIILTGQSDSYLGERAIRMGIQDYMQKKNMNQKSLEKAIEYSISRFDLWLKVQILQNERLKDRENNYLRKTESKISVNLKSALDHRPLRNTDPVDFGKFSNLYYEAIQSYADEKKQHDLIEELVFSLANYRVVPEDLVSLHKAAIKQCERNFSPSEFKDILQKSHFLLIDSVSLLALIYREEGLT